VQSSPAEASRALIDGRYLLESQLGKGSMGTVWQAFDSRLKRRIALKLLHREGDGPEQVGRELQALARLRHPNLVHVLDGGTTADGEPYLAMELVDGTTLKEELERVSKLPVARACRIGGQVVRALIGAHAEGVVHRDLKPSNIMLGELYGELDVVKLVDFGIARLVDGTRTTRTGSHFAGTPRYASPEQFQGSAATPSSDLYSLGVVLHEALSGRPLFHAEEEVAFVWHHVNTLPQRLSELDSSVPEWLDALVWALLKKDPKQRPKDAQEVLACIEGTRGPEQRASSAAAQLGGTLVAAPATAATPTSAVAASSVRPSRVDRKLVTAVLIGSALTFALVQLASKTSPRAEARSEPSGTQGQAAPPSAAPTAIPAPKEAAGAAKEPAPATSPVPQGSAAPSAGETPDGLHGEMPSRPKKESNKPDSASALPPRKAPVQESTPLLNSKRLERALTERHGVPAESTSTRRLAP
jgi:eukaryotic-like serine/threonine-protein kinase